MINPRWMQWSSVPIPLGLRWMGVGFGVIAGMLLIVVMRTLGRNLTDTVVTRERHTLVNTGVYRWARHPFYTTCALALIADTLVTANWFLGLTGAAVIALLVIRTKTEEQKLIEHFGSDYEDYMTRTGRFLPRMMR
jgi:protein-S-isoprenylcysteine O-methyltransferase Ste14